MFKPGDILILQNKTTPSCFLLEVVSSTLDGFQYSIKLQWERDKIAENWPRDEYASYKTFAMYYHNYDIDIYQL